MIRPDGAVVDAEGRVYAIVANPEVAPEVRARWHRLNSCKCKGELSYHERSQAVAS